MRVRNQSNLKYPRNWRVRERGEMFYISFRVPKEARPLWNNKAEVLLGKGKTEQEAATLAYRRWSTAMHSDTTPETLGDLLDRYLNEVVPTKARKTQVSNEASLKRLRAALAEIPVPEFKTFMAYQYRDAVGKQISQKTANLDIEVLSHCFTKAFEWGAPITEHPIKQKVTKFKLLARQRYVEDWELDALVSVANPFLKAYLPLKLATGKDQSMILAIKLSDIREDGLHFPKREKTKGYAGVKASIMPFEDKAGNSTGLREILDDVMAWRSKALKIGSIYLFATRDGNPYYDGNNNSAFKSVWQRAMKKALTKTDLEEKFTEHDLCSKTASDVETIEEAAQLRGHTNTKTTRENYRVKPEIVLPFRKKAE